MNDKRGNKEEIIRMWKNDYENIPVPEEAKNRIYEGINRAKKEKRRSDIMRYFKRTGVSVAALVVTLGVAVNASPVFANAVTDIPVIGSIAKVITFRTYTDEHDKMMADVKVPKIDGEAAVNKEIDAYAQNLIAKYEKEVSESAGEGNYSLYSNYEVVAENENYVSIRINTVITQASGAEFVKVFTVDKQTGEEVSLSEFLNNDKTKLDKASANIKEQMKDQMEKDENKVYFTEGPGAFEGLTGDESFYMNENGELVIVFSEYEVAPGYMGTVSFTIPSDVLK